MEINSLKKLEEITVFRPLIILSLVLNHSIVKISAGGSRVSGYSAPDFYNYFNDFNFAFTLEAFALISGYVMAYQLFILKRDYSFKSFAYRKFKRLIIPMLVFGIAYYFMFLFEQSTFSVLSFLVRLLSGCGHLWFLPMLFWGQLILFFLVKKNYPSKYVWPMLLIISLVPTPHLPLGFERLAHFMLWIYAGSELLQLKNIVIQKMNMGVILLLGGVMVMLVVIRNLVLPDMESAMPIIDKVAFYVRNEIIGIPMKASGILAVYFLICKYTGNDSYIPSKVITFMSEMSFGIYLIPLVSTKN